MAHVSWKTEKTKEFLGNKPLYKDGKPVIEDGVQKTYRDNKPVTFECPFVSMELGTVDDLSVALAEILQAGKTGFTTLSELIDHFNYGAKKNIARKFNQGLNIAYTHEQQQTINLYKRIMLLPGGLGVETLVDSLMKQGIANPYAALGLADPTEEGEEEAS